jgi:hypothetical protein
VLLPLSPAPNSNNLTSFAALSASSFNCLSNRLLNYKQIII